MDPTDKGEEKEEKERKKERCESKTKNWKHIHGLTVPGMEGKY